MNTKEFTDVYYIDRKKNDSVKWQRGVKMDCLPMWIADMDFKGDQKVIDSLKEFIEKGDYGYANLPKDYYDVLIDFHRKRHGIEYKPEWIRFTKGAIDAMYQVIYSLTELKDGIMISTPAYPPFYSTVKESGRKLYTTKMIDNGGYFTFDYKDIEARFRKGKISMFILCSPHNPLGRVFKKGELEELFELCKKYDVLVLADEVHCDIIMPDQEFFPALSFKKYRRNIVSICAAAKSFSLAVFSHCHVIIPDPALRKKFIAYQRHTHTGSVNVFNALSTYYSYKYGSEWLDGVIDVIYENYSYFRKELSPYYEMTNLEGTYLLFVNIAPYNKDRTAFDTLVSECKILANAGESFGEEYSSWVRINLATSPANIRKAVRSLKKLAKEKQDQACS